MLTLTTAPANILSNPVRVSVGSGLSVTIPDGPGRPSVRWHERAEIMRHRLKELYDRTGAALECRRDGSWLEVRVVDEELPACSLLTHPRLSELLVEALEIHFGASPAVYYREGKIRARVAEDAPHVEGWIGPLDLSAGYCMALPLK
ncbi:hypothetical protein GSS87_00345 [Corynebacterium sp. 4HC-13]|uniref:hypothetical protein n=1 Tax=Corynebacterium anserum TaxID=2684406 RepID=UPI00163A4304|nr:hypothetical protein [Corynebacterium anserum]MBC2680884.1 hypothetical protein [Corynebacterium anserum]